VPKRVDDLLVAVAQNIPTGPTSRGQVKGNYRSQILSGTSCSAIAEGVSFRFHNEAPAPSGPRETPLYQQPSPGPWAPPW
jgi:hypothetical protein